jgi:hypothetical protein
MSNIVTIGLLCEGTTDERFLLSVIKRTFDEVALECASQLEVYDPELVDGKGLPFVAMVQQAATSAQEHGIMVLCVHTDADSADDRTAFEFKINPAFSAVVGPQYCEALVAVVPIRMTEAWMLADAELLREEIDPVGHGAELVLPARPESEHDPKETITELIRLALASRSRRQRDQLRIGDLYQPIGQKLNLRKLERLSSYQKFKESVRAAYRKLNYLV